MRASELTVGVEEEFFLADVTTRHAVLRAETVLEGTAPVSGGGRMEPELARAQVESVSAVCRDIGSLREDLLRLRRSVATAAESNGCRLVASGTVPLGDPGPPPVSDRPRYHRIAERFGPLLDQQSACACHVHVGVPDPEEAVQVVNHLRIWLPVLLVLSSNSPFWQGRDTGYASWRTPLFARWPTAGPPPYLSGREEYEEIVEGLRETGAILDGGMLFWYARPSRHVPTVEVRVADVMPTVDDTVLFAALVRALVATVLTDLREGRAAPAVGDHLLRAACWRAARYGLRGDGVDVSGRVDERLIPASGQIKQLMEYVSPALESSGEDGAVRAGLRALRLRGTGADRQRAAYRRRNRFEDVVDLLADRALT